MKFIDTSTITHIYIDALISTVLDCTNQTLQRKVGIIRGIRTLDLLSLHQNFVYHHAQGEDEIDAFHGVEWKKIRKKGGGWETSSVQISPY